MLGEGSLAAALPGAWIASLGRRECRLAAILLWGKLATQGFLDGRRLRGRGKGRESVIRPSVETLAAPQLPGGDFKTR